MATVTAEAGQWEAAAKAVETYGRLRVGDLSVILRLAEEGSIPVRVNVPFGGVKGDKLRSFGPDVAEAFKASLDEAQNYVSMAGPIGGSSAALVDAVLASVAGAAAPDGDGPRPFAGP
jgi:hypothetical protein